MLIYGIFLVLNVDKIIPYVSSEERLETSVNRLSKQIEKLFLEQSRFDLVEKGLSEHLQAKLFLQQNDFKETTTNSESKIQKFINLKIKALINLVQKSEEVTESYVYNQKWIPDVVVSKFRSNPLPGEDPTKFEKKCEQYLRNISKHDAYNVKKNNDMTRSAIHVTVESFKCENAVLRDYEWTKSELLEKTLKENQQIDPSIVRQFIGTNSGLTKMLPAIKWKVEPPEITMDLFDPRHRPWFLIAEMSPKDIIFLIDYSGSVKGQTLHLIKVTIQFILTTLTPNDYFTAIFYNNIVGFILDECCGETFIPATTKNKRLLMTMLDKIEERDVANLASALNYTFDRFEREFDITKEEKLRSALGDAGYSGGHKLIMLFTDGIENWPNEVIKQYKSDYPDEIIRIFGFSMGYGTGYMAALDSLTCETQGSYAIVDSITDVRLQCRSYLQKLSEILALSYKDKSPDERPITWSLPYMDAQSGGATITLSMPILNVMENASTSFSGVAGIDISFPQLRDLLPSNDQIYSFIIDNNGIVLFHPKLRIPKRETYAIRRTACYNIRVKLRHETRVPYGIIDERVQRLIGLVDSISTVDIQEIEKQTPKFLEFRRLMIDKKCGSIIDDGSRQYRCYHIKGTPLTVGFIYNKRYPDFIMKNDPSIKMPTLTYTPRDLVGYLIAEKTLCPDELGAYQPLDRFEPFIFGDFNTCPKNSEKYLPFAFIRGIQDWDRSWPNLEDNSTCMTNPLPFNLNSKYFISSFVQFYQGITVFYPKCTSEYVRDFTSNPFLYPSLQPDAVNKIYVDHEPLSGSITVTKPIFDNNYGYRIASIGVQWSYRYLSDLWLNITRDDPGWKDCLNPNIQCYLLSNGAFILGSNNGASGRHMGETEAMLLDSLIESKSIEKEVIRDYQADCPMEKRGYQILSGSNRPKPVNLMTMIQRVIQYFYSILTIDIIYFVEKVFSRPIVTNGQCRYETPENTEQCTLEFSKYHLINNKGEKLIIHLGNDKSCKGTVTIIPFKIIDISLLIFNGECEASRYNSENKYWPQRIPDCNQTTQYYRKLRDDLDYSRFHENESVNECIKVNFSNQLEINLLTLLVFTSIY